MDGKWRDKCFLTYLRMLVVKMKLPCKHMACAGCITQLWMMTYENQSRGKRFSCPHCHALSTSLSELKVR